MMFEVVSRTSLAHALLRDDLFRVCSGSDHAEAVLLTVLPTSRIPVVAATACVVPFLLNPAAALGRISPWHMKLQCLDDVAAFLLGVCYTEKAPNAWQRRGTQKTRNTYNQPNRSNQQIAQTKHQAPPKRQPGRRITFLLGVSSAVCTRQPPPRLCWHTFACLPGPPSMLGCSAYGPGPMLPRRACLRLILLCTCPPLFAGVLWPMPAWVWA